MNWLNIKEVLPPETIREILNKRIINVIKYYPKPRDETCNTAILIEVTKQKEIVPIIIEIQEALPFNSEVNRIVIREKTIRYKDRNIFSREEMQKIVTIFKLLGLRVFI